MFQLILLFILCYIVGSFPTGYWICRWWFGLDVTKMGSGNIGASNVGRILDSPKIFALVFLLDAIKAFSVLAIADAVLHTHYHFALTYNYLLLCAFCVLVGNAFSIFLGFKGGKGVATTVGLIGYLASFWLVLAFVLCWGLLLLITKHAFMASLGSTYLVTGLYIAHYARTDDFLVYFLLAVCFWITLRHHRNIKNFLWNKPHDGW